MGCCKHSSHYLLILEKVVSIFFKNTPERFALRGIHDTKFSKKDEEPSIKIYLINPMTDIHLYEQTFHTLPPLSVYPDMIESLKITSCHELYEIKEFPPHLISLTITDCPIKVLPPFPRTLRVLILKDCGIQRLPPLLHTSLWIFCCKNTSLDRIPDLPSTVEILHVEDVTMNQLSKQLHKAHVS